MTMRTQTQDAPPRARSRIWLAVLPVAVFSGLAVLFYFSLSNRDPSQVPSALIGKPVPQFSLPPLEGLLEDGKPVPGFSTADLAKGRITLVNVWGSWCGPCRIEHPFLMQLRERHKLAIYGLNYKDEPANARRFLGAYGSPFVAVGTDRLGRSALDWGVYGVPETFIVDGLGQIRYKFIGPLNQRAVDTVIMPIVNKIALEPTSTKN